jgi:hypothetical protein
MVVLTVEESSAATQAMDSTVLVHAKRPDAWHSKHEQMMIMEMDKQKGKGETTTNTKQR